MFKKEFILTLLNINQIGRKTINKLILNPLPVLMEPSHILNFLSENLPHYKFNLTIKDIIVAKNKSLNIIDYCKKNNINIMTILDDDFPLKLKLIDDNPVIIFYKGNKSCILDNKAIAIIGTRSPTIEGEKASIKLAKVLSSSNYIIVSGLAYGIDYHAHISTINNKGKTLGVLPSGISNIYPSNHRRLCEDIINNNGCIISEYLPFEKPYKNHFIERDRLQSALSLGIIVVECNVNSGTMHTVNFAKEQNKLICCHKYDNMKISCRSGNNKILKDKNILILDSNYNIDFLDKSLKSKLHSSNISYSYINSSNEQIFFNI